MFLYTNHRQEEFDALQSRKYSSPGQSYFDYKMNVPLQVEFISMRPDDPLEYFTMVSVIPEHIYHASLTKEEIGSMFAKPRLHRHSYYELAFVLSGNLFYNIENRRHQYTPGSCCLLNCNVLHTEEYETDFDVMFLGISDKVLRDVYQNLTEGFFTLEQSRPDTDMDRFLKENLLAEKTSYDKEYVDFIPRKAEDLSRAGIPIGRYTAAYASQAGDSGVPAGRNSSASGARRDDAGASRPSFHKDSAADTDTYGLRPDDACFSPNPAVRRVRGILNAIEDDLLSPCIGSTYQIKALIAKLLHQLSDPTYFETTPIQIGTDAENLLYNEIDRIMHETRGRASRSFLEEELHYSGNYLNKITKKYTGLTIHDFGMTICMACAARDLLDTDHSIGDIAASLGFSNRTHFYKQFDKVYHVSPAEYRKNYRNELK